MTTNVVSFSITEITLSGDSLPMKFTISNNLIIVDIFARNMNYSFTASELIISSFDGEVCVFEDDSTINMLVSEFVSTEFFHLLRVEFGSRESDSEVVEV